MTEVKESLHLDATVQPEASAGQHSPAKSLRRSRIDEFLSYLILACGLSTVVVGAYVILTSHSTVPIYDEWTQIDPVATAPQHVPPLSWLWAQHHEHRIIFYRLLLLADIHFFRGRHWIYFPSMLAVQCASLAVLFWLARLGGLRGTLLRATAGLGAFCLFCPTQWQNFGWAFQISFLLPTLFLALALLGLLKLERLANTDPRQWAYLALSILAASAATYSNGNGAVVWPALLLVAAALRLRLRFLVAYVISAGVMVGSYLNHYASPSVVVSPLESIRHPLSVLLYFICYLGVVLPPWVRIHTIVAATTGAFGLLAGLTASARVLLQARWRKPFPLALVGFMLFSVATAFITALGRISFGVDQAFQSRYQTFNLLFWFATVTLWLLMADETIPLLRNALLVLMPVTMLAAMTQYPLILKAPRLMTHRSEAAAMSLLAGVPDRQALAILSPFPQDVWRDRDFLREQRLFVFSGPLYGQIGEPLSNFYHAGPPTACAGQVQVVERVPIADSVTGQDSGGLRVSGWAVDASQEPAQLLVFATDGRIAGFAVGGIQLSIAGDRAFMKKTKFTEWSGAARTAPGIQLMEVYAVDNHHPQELCHLATARVPEN